MPAKRRKRGPACQGGREKCRHRWGIFQHLRTDGWERVRANLWPWLVQMGCRGRDPLGRGKGFPVTAIEPNRALVLSDTNDGFQWVWQFGLYPLDEGRTRLVSRGTQRFSNTIGSWLFMRVMEPAAFIMTRRMLLGLKERAEVVRAAARSGEGRATRQAA